MALSSLALDYYNWLRSLTRKLRVNAFWFFLSGVVVFLFNQLFLVLAFFLPLKVIIMVGTEGIPRYLRFVIDQSNKDEFITILAFLAIGFYILFLVSELVLAKLGSKTAAVVLARSKKITMFEQQTEFASDVFMRVVRTCGTVFMIAAGFTVGFFLEWRIFFTISCAIFLEFFLMHLIWNHCQKAENVKARVSFIKNRTNILNALSALNFFIGFAVLFLLFITNSVANFIIGILMILLLRQIFQRMNIAINDSIYLTKEKPKIVALFYTHSHFVKDKHYITNTFDRRLKPENRDSFIKEILKDKKSMASLEWQWSDSAESGTALFSAASLENHQYWLKLYPANKESAFERSKLIYGALNQKNVTHVPSLLGAGYVSGVYYLLLETRLSIGIDFRSRQRALKKWLLESWVVPPPISVANIIERSLPTLGKRINKETLSMLYLATRDKSEEDLVTQFLSLESVLVDYIDKAPKFLRNKDLSDVNTMYHGENMFTLLHWQNVEVDPVCSDIQLRKLGKAFDPKSIAEKLKAERRDCSDFGTLDVKKIVYIRTLDKYLKQGRYRAAFNLIKPITKFFK